MHRYFIINKCIEILKPLSISQ